MNNCVFLVQKAVSNGNNWRFIDLVLGVGKTTVLIKFWNRNMNVVENVESGQHVTHGICRQDVNLQYETR